MSLPPELASTLFEFLVALVSAMLLWLGHSVRRYVEASIEDKKVRMLLTRFQDGIEQGVHQVSQTLVPIAREMASDGKISSEGGRKLLEAAKEVAFDQLTPSEKKHLIEMFGETHLDRVADERVEATVHKVKGGK